MSNTLEKMVNDAHWSIARKRGLRTTPHGAALSQNFATARLATFALLDNDCLIRSISVDAGRVTICLHRPPSFEANLEPMLVRVIGSPCYKEVVPDWRGVRLEWFSDRVAEHIQEGGQS